MAVLGSMLLGSSDAVSSMRGVLAASDFYREAHGRIFEAMMHLSGKGEPVDIVTLKDELSRRGALDSSGGVDYLIVLSDYVPTTANIVYYAEIIADKSARRQMISLASEVAAMAYSEAETETMAVHARKLTTIGSRPSTRQKVSLLRDVLSEEFDQVNDRYHALQRGEVTQGVLTGLSELDELLTGLKPGELHLVAARPGNGKSALAVTCSMAAAKYGGVLFASLEMSKSQLAQRILSGESKVDSHAIRTGALVDAEWGQIQNALSNLWDLPLYIATVPALKPSELYNYCRDITGLRLLVVDYLQLMGSDETAFKREEMLSTISRTLKQIALELEIPVMALAQLNREVEKRENKRPMLSDIRESGALEQDADAVWMLYRASYYADQPADAREADETEIIIRKNRQGPIGTAKVGFIAAETRFVNLANREDSPW
jgi:replicative DNA helicase